MEVWRPILQEGQVIPGIESPVMDVLQWNPSVARVRDCVLERRIIGLTVEPLPSSSPDNISATIPTQQQVEWMQNLAIDAVIHGRMIDFGHLPWKVIDRAATRVAEVWEGGPFVSPFTAAWLMYHTSEADTGVHLIQPRENHYEVTELQPCLFGDVTALAICDRALIWSGVNTQDQTCAGIPSVLRYLEGYKDTNGAVTPGIAAMGNLVSRLFTALLILNTRNIERTTITADAKLNKARAKSHKPPIPPYDRVTTAPYVTAIMARHQHSEDRGGTHASPIPHLRRGHPRTYSDGKVSLIRDTLVNVSADARATFRSARTHYQVKP